MRDVIQVVAELDACGVRTVGVALLHLGPAREAGTYQVAVGVARNSGRKVAYKSRLLRAWANQAHVAHEHVEELRQLVQTATAQQASHAGDAWVFGLCKVHAGGLQAMHHAAEFPKREDFTISAHAGLRVKRRTLGVKAHCQRDACHQGQPQGG